MNEQIILHVTSWICGAVDPHEAIATLRTKAREAIGLRDAFVHAGTEAAATVTTASAQQHVGQHGHQIDDPEAGPTARAVGGRANERLRAGQTVDDDVEEAPEGGPNREDEYPHGPALLPGTHESAPGTTTRGADDWYPPLCHPQ